MLHVLPGGRRHFPQAFLLNNILDLLKNQIDHIQLDNNKKKMKNPLKANLFIFFIFTSYLITKN
jgi:hypothetical protein